MTSREQIVRLGSNRFIIVAILIAGNFVVETTTTSSNEDDNSFSLIKEILYQVL